MPRGCAADGLGDSGRGDDGPVQDQEALAVPGVQAGLGVPGLRGAPGGQPDDVVVGGHRLVVEPRPTNRSISASIWSP